MGDEERPRIPGVSCKVRPTAEGGAGQPWPLRIGTEQPESLVTPLLVMDLKSGTDIVAQGVKLLLMMLLCAIQGRADPLSI